MAQIDEIFKELALLEEQIGIEIDACPDVCIRLRQYLMGKRAGVLTAMTALR